MHNDKAVNIAMMIQHWAQHADNFRQVVDNPTMSLISRSSQAEDEQLTFFHTIQGSEIIGRNYYALTGMCIRVTPIKTDTALFFCRSTV